MHTLFATVENHICIFNYFFASYVIPLSRGLLNATHRGLTFTWWGCYGLCLWHKLTELAQSFLFCSCVYFCRYDPFNCIPFHKFSQQLSVFSLCSSGLISDFLVLSTIYLFMKVSFSSDIILSGWLGSKHQLTKLNATLWYLCINFIIKVPGFVWDIGDVIQYDTVSSFGAKFWTLLLF